MNMMKIKKDRKYLTTIKPSGRGSIKKKKKSTKLKLEQQWKCGRKSTLSCQEFLKQCKKASRAWYEEEKEYNLHFIEKT